MKVLKWLLPVLLILGIALYFGGKYWVKERGPEVFGISQVKVSIGQDSIFLNLRLRVPTDKPVKWLVDSMRYRVYFDTVQFSSGMKNFKTESPDTLIDLPLGMDRELLFSTIQKMQGKDSMYLNVELEPYFNKKPIPFKITRKMRVPIPPEVTVEKLKIDEINLKEIGLDASLQIVNLNDFEFIIAEGVIDIDFIEMFNGHIDIMEPVHLKARDTTRMDVDIEIGELRVAKTAWKMAVNQKGVLYDISGKLFVTTVDSPDDTIDVVLSSPGLKLKE